MSHSFLGVEDDDQRGYDPAAFGDQTRTPVVGDHDLNSTPLPAFTESADNPVAHPFEEVGHYRVLEVLGQGGFGTVVKAYDRKLLRVVALKTMMNDLAATSPARKRFLREARAGAAVRHENVVCIYAVEETPVPYLVMEYVPGLSLQKHLDDQGPLAVTEVLRIGARIARGLAAAHATGLIHRDVKPANVMLLPGETPTVKLTDFGLARAVDDAALTQSGMVSGTPMYMAPEQARGESPDHRSDLFSLGSVLYVMVTGRPPFRANSSLAVMARVAEAAPRPIREIIPETPSWLCDIIAKLHAREPEDRYACAEEVAKVLERSLAAWQLGVLDINPLPSRPNVPVVPKVAPTNHRHRLGWKPFVVAASVVFGAASAACLAFVTKFGESRAEVAVAPLPEIPSKPNLEVPPSPPPLPAPPPLSGPSPALAHRHLANRVTAGIRALNPQFTGEIQFEFEGDKIVAISIHPGSFFVDPSPLRELVDLRRAWIGTGDFENLEAFRGLKLTDFRIMNTSTVRDLSPLQGMPLEQLCVWGFQGTDLSPLKGMKLKEFNVGLSRVKDISVLRGMPITIFCMNYSEVDDLEVLRDMPLSDVLINATKVTDLEPLRGKKLTKLWLHGLRPKNTDVVWSLPLESLDMDILPEDHDRLRAMTTLRQIKGLPAAEFFKTIK